MKLSKFVGASVLALSLTGLPAVLPASAQTNTTPNTAPNRTEVETDRRTGTEYRTQDNDFDWGWLGLLGLIGLAGLARKREEPARYREPNEVGTPGQRF